MPSQDTINKLKVRRLRERRAADREAQILGKSEAITPELMAETAKVFGVNVDPELAMPLSNEHEYFENAMTAAETECFSKQTVVGIGEYKNKGFVFVLNELKILSSGVFGLGFPGGRVRLGESPDVRLKKEYIEETGLVCEVVNSDQKPVGEHKVGIDGEHFFSAYANNIVRGEPQIHPTKNEPITAIICIDEETLVKLCTINNARMYVEKTHIVAGTAEIKAKVRKRELVVGVLRSHRLVFLDYIKAKNYTKQEATPMASVEEVTSV